MANSEHILGEKVGKTTVKWKGKDRVEVSIYYSKEAESPDTSIQLYIDEMDELARWWGEQKER